MEIKEEAMVMLLHLKRFTNALQKADHVVCISKALYTLNACHLHAAETYVDVEQHNLVLAHLTQQYLQIAFPLTLNMKAYTQDKTLANAL